jgi:fatty-acid desaturase
MLFVMVGGQLLVIGLQRFVYPSWTRIAFSLMSAALASMLIERLLHRRVAHKSR